MLDAALNSNVICVLLLQVFSLACVIILVFVLTHQVLDNSSFCGVVVVCLFLLLFWVFYWLFCLFFKEKTKGFGLKVNFIK